jgi:hypothetical protein
MMHQHCYDHVRLKNLTRINVIKFSWPSAASKLSQIPIFWNTGIWLNIDAADCPRKFYNYYIPLIGHYLLSIFKNLNIKIYYISEAGSVSECRQEGTYNTHCGAH